MTVKHCLILIMRQVVACGIIAAIVIFQPEVRSGLEHMKKSVTLRHTISRNYEDEATILNFDKAIQYMSKERIGALITIERNVLLDEFMASGIVLDADISEELIINIFIPNTPLHDGAVIVSKGKIAVANAYLPLSGNKSIPQEFGTRHRAAVGVSEVSDAVTIIVSEETGGVSLALNSELLPRLTREEYLKILKEALTPCQEAKKIQRVWNGTKNK